MRALYIPQNSLLYLFTHCESCRYVVINRIGGRKLTRETCVCTKYLKPPNNRTEKYLFSDTRERKRESNRFYLACVCNAGIL